MQAALHGALFGLGIAAFLVIAEYLLLVKHARERAARLHRKEAAIDEAGQRRLRALVAFALALPPAFAAGFWIVWG